MPAKEADHQTGEEKGGVVGRRGHDRRGVFRDSGWSRRGYFAAGGRRRKMLDGGGRVRYAVCADGSFSLKNISWSCSGG